MNKKKKKSRKILKVKVKVRNQDYKEKGKGHVMQWKEHMQDVLIINYQIPASLQ